MARESGPIARMLFEHEFTIKLAEKNRIINDRIHTE